MEKISVIVPVYNVEKYIDKCMDSITNQTYKNLEIILVDDGSTDSSGKICDEYAKKDNRIKVIHKENGGLSSARNAGIDIASGKYIGFIDSDDYIELDMYETLYNIITEKNADISACGVIDVYNNNTKVVKNDSRIVELNTEQALKTFLEAKGTGHSVFAVNKLYKKEVFENIRYPIGRIAEDAFVIVEILLQCKKVVITTAKKYYYIHREDSITTKKFSNKNYDVIEAYIRNKQLIEKSYTNLIPIAEMRICWANFFVLDKMLLSNEKPDKKILKYLRSKFLFILFNNVFTINRKISMCALMINFRLYKILLLKFNNKNKKIFL